MADTELVLRRAAAEDAPEIRALLAATFPANPKAHADVMAWQYWHNPFGPPISMVWEAGGRIVCHWAVVRVPLRIAGRDVAGAKTADAATAADWRGRGLFAQLGRRLFAECADAGVVAALTHPNPNAARGVAQAGAVQVARVPAYALLREADLVASRTPLPPALARLAVRALWRVPRGTGARRVAAPPEDLGGLARRAGAVTGIVRDEVWWRWRYVDRPRAAYSFAEARRGAALVGAAAAVERDALGSRLLHLLELNAVDADAARALVGALLEGSDVAGVLAIALPGTRLAALLRGAGLHRVPRRLEPWPLRFMVAAPGGDAHALARERWSIAWGDLDHL